jgi:homoserine O-acetyltransferase
LRLQRELADLIPTADGLHTIASPYGHDGFLLETDAVAQLVRHTLRRAEAKRSDEASRLAG